MDPKVRKAALRAAAKTAIALSLAGGTLALGPGCASSHPRAPVPASSDAGAAIADGGDACGELLASLELFDGGDLWTARFASDEAREDPRVGGCCLALHEQALAEGPGDIDPAVGMACCDVVVFAQGLAAVSPLGCTPWGPPCPPAAPV